MDDNEEATVVTRDTSYYIGAAFGISCAVVGGFYTVILSGPIKDLPSFMVIFYAAMAGILVALFSSIFNPNQQLVSSEVRAFYFDYLCVYWLIRCFPPNRLQGWSYFSSNWILLCCMTAGGIVSNWSSTKSFQMTDPTTIIVVHQLEILFGFIFQVNNEHFYVLLFMKFDRTEVHIAFFPPPNLNFLFVSLIDTEHLSSIIKGTDRIQILGKNISDVMLR